MKCKSGIIGLCTLTLALIGAAVIDTPLTAQQSVPYTFKNVTIVAGGFISGIVPHPTKPGLMYLRTDIGGAYRWDALRKVWIPLTDWVSPSAGNLLGIESIAVDPTDPQKLYLAAGTYDKSWSANGAILRSNDQGAHFDISPMPIKMGGNEDGRFAGERLAVDPNSPNILYFGSRNDGLWKSIDGARTWARVDAFPGASQNKIGVVFVDFDATSGHSGSPTPVLYAGVSAPGASLYRSRNAGKTWQAVPGTPAGLLPIHGALTADGSMYLTFGDQPGPNGMTRGQVWKLNTANGKWTDITPEGPGIYNSPSFGYAGLALDRGAPTTIMVATMDRWNKGDEIFRSTDGGAHWNSIGAHSERDDSLSPYLAGADGTVKLGHWIGTIAIDPFDANHALYGTGETLWSTSDLKQLDRKKTAHWVVGAAGIEETAVVSLLSPPKGAHLFSGLGDIGCFRNDDFSVSPREGSLKNPHMSNCDSMDYAAAKPELMVRVGRAWSGEAHGSLSTDGGITWKTFASEPAGAASGGTIAISADGTTLLWATGRGTLAYSHDLGNHWTVNEQAPRRVHIVADRVRPARFYLYDRNESKLYVVDAPGMDLKAVPLSVPKSSKLYVEPGLADTLWFATDAGLWHADATAAKPPQQTAGVDRAIAIGFGKAKDDGAPVTLFLSGTVAGQDGVFRSTDHGLHWTRINDDQHNWGYVGNVAGDPRIFGRVYIGTNGRGVFTGDPQP